MRETHEAKKNDSVLDFRSKWSGAANFFKCFFQRFFVFSETLANPSIADTGYIRYLLKYIVQFSFVVLGFALLSV